MRVHHANSAVVVMTQQWGGKKYTNPGLGSSDSQHSRLVVMKYWRPLWEWMDSHHYSPDGAAYSVHNLNKDKLSSAETISQQSKN